MWKNVLSRFKLEWKLWSKSTQEIINHMQRSVSRSVSRSISRSIFWLPIFLKETTSVKVVDCPCLWGFLIFFFSDQIDFILKLTTFTPKIFFFSSLKRYKVSSYKNWELPYQRICTFQMNLSWTMRFLKEKNNNCAPPYNLTSVISANKSRDQNWLAHYLPPSNSVRWKFLRAWAFETHNCFTETFAVINVVRIVAKMLLGIIWKAFLTRSFISGTCSTLE